MPSITEYNGLKILDTTPVGAGGQALNDNFVEIADHITNSENPHGVTTTQIGAIPTGLIGSANGVAPLNSSSKLEDTYIESADIWDAKQDGNANLTSLSNLSYTQSSIVRLTGINSFALDNTSYLPVNIDSPSLDQVIKYNGAEWINGSPTSVGAGKGTMFFPLLIASDITGYYYFSTTPGNMGEQVISGVCNDGYVELVKFINQSGYNVQNIDAGVWGFNLWGKCSETGSRSRFISCVWRRDVSGTETMLFCASGDPLTTSLSSYYAETIQPAYTLASTDRLIFKISAYTSATEDVVTFVYGGGSEHYSYVTTPMATRHNDLAGLQGGTNSQYYHLNQSQYSGFNNLKIGSMGINLDGAGSVITTGYKGYLYIPYNCTINSSTLLADKAGSIIMDIRKGTISSFPTTTSVVASSKPTLSSSQSITDSTLTGWTTTLSTDDILEFIVESSATLTRVNLILKVTK